MVEKIKERREFPRINLSIALRYQVRGSREVNNALSRDISLGGIRFRNGQFLIPTSEVALEINLLSYILRPIGRVVWSQPIPHSNTYQSGIEFTEFTPQERIYLKEYIDMQLGKL
ncbi:MAG: PilZ domain-containing protein [Candidatus Omnitrophica bacterium]|nr:PilZ domain-containing protein [Candidatus Omnitrophota bacterium]